VPFAPAAPRGLAPGAALASASLAAAALAGGLAGGGRTNVGQDLFFQATQLRGKHAAASGTGAGSGRTVPGSTLSGSGPPIQARQGQDVILAQHWSADHGSAEDA